MQLKFTASAITELWPRLLNTVYGPKLDQELDKLRQNGNSAIFAFYRCRVALDSYTVGFVSDIIFRDISSQITLYKLSL